MLIHVDWYKFRFSTIISIKTIRDFFFILTDCTSFFVLFNGTELMDGSDTILAFENKGHYYTLLCIHIL